MNRVFDYTIYALVLLWCVFVILLMGAFMAHAKTPMLASVYWEDRWVATGARFDANGMTAAHKSLPLGTRLTVSFRHRSVVLTINDRGPFVRKRELDLSKGAAKALKFPGLGKVKVESWPPLPKPDPRKETVDDLPRTAG